MIFFSFVIYKPAFDIILLRGDDKLKGNEHTSCNWGRLRMINEGQFLFNNHVEERFTLWEFVGATWQHRSSKLWWPSISSMGSSNTTSRQCYRIRNYALSQQRPHDQLSLLAYTSGWKKLRKAKLLSGEALHELNQCFVQKHNTARL